MSPTTRTSKSKTAYSRPTMTVYGGLAKLTATGTVPGNENGGMPTEKA